MQWPIDDFHQTLPMRVSVKIEGRTVVIAPSKYAVTGCSGHVIPVYLLDTDLPENSSLNGELNSGCAHYSLCQEVVPQRLRLQHHVATEFFEQSGTRVAPRIPAEPLEAALLLRIRELSAWEFARDEIVEQAASLLDDEGPRLAKEEEIVRRQLA